MNPLLSIQQLSVVFRTDHSEVAAVKNFSLTVNRGEVVAIVGESGSGKSVTALSILRDHAQDSVTNDPAAHRR